VTLDIEAVRSCQFARLDLRCADRDTVSDAPALWLKAMGARFSVPEFPGELLRTEIWMEPAHVLFRSRGLARDLVVPDGGRAEVSDHG
jgi:hypothetical protein